MRKAQKPDVHTLRSDPAYQLIAELGFDDMLPFVMEHIRKKGFFQVFYLLVNIGLLTFLIMLSAKGLSDQTLIWKQLIIQGAGGILAGSILIIPIHELLHALAYRILGVRKIIFGADPGQMIFYVTADRFPVSGMQVHFLTMTPFFIINLLTITANVFLLEGGLLFSVFFLLCHNLMCIGDFAISGYLCEIKGRVYTFDEPEKKLSYFYKEI